MEKKNIKENNKTNDMKRACAQYGTRIHSITGSRKNFTGEFYLIFADFTAIERF